MRHLFILSCGARKRETAEPAHALYTGSYFRYCLKYARLNAGLENIYILSALHGLIPSTRVIEPYDVPMKRASTSERGMRRERTKEVEALSTALAALGLTAGDKITALMSGAYLDLLRAAKPPCPVDAPIAGLQVGRALHHLRLLSELGEADHG